MQRWKCNLGVILAERKRDGLPYARLWLAEQIEISRQQIGNIIDGADPHLSIAIKISKVLGRDLFEIWSEAEEP